jgi:NAD(P)-dependent dehydrogenase (short-subunit alcohol dehydrogenase family)
MTNSALASQAVVIKGDEAHSTLMFPKGATDVNGQQVDLRRENSWMLRLHQVSTDEMAEVLTINTMAPAVINARLKVCMERNAKDWKFIVNVSAMEGKFYRYKSKNHPHTNMAKAALNMMTRTSAQDYVTSLIYMTAVDTGWINDEKPVELAVQHERMHNFQTPIDEVDAASRVLDPVISPLLQREQGVAGVSPPWGVFLKDYQKCEW